MKFIEIQRRSYCCTRSGIPAPDAPHHSQSRYGAPDNWLCGEIEAETWILICEPLLLRVVTIASQLRVSGIGRPGDQAGRIA